MKGLVAIFSLALVFQMGAEARAEVVSPIADAFYPVSPCTPQEEWTFPRSLPQSWRDRVIESSKDRDAAVANYFYAVALFQRSTTPEQKAFSQFWLGRILYQLKFIHLAQRAFLRAIETKTPNSLGVRLGTAECLNVIRQTFPTLENDGDILTSFSPAEVGLISEPQRSYLRDAAVYSAKRKLANQTNPDLSVEMRLAQGSSGHEVMLEVLKAAQGPVEADLANLSRKLPRSFSAPLRFKEDEALLRLSIARGIYGVGKFKVAAEHYKLVTNKSNLFPQALTERSWAALSQDHFAESIGLASNLIVGGLKKTFCPEAFSVAAIALNETCNFPEAVDLIKAFRKTYGPTYKWLYDWRASKNYEAANLYALATGFLKKQKKVPERVGLEWFRSPVFTSYQQELNLIIDERQNLGPTWVQIVRSTTAASRKSLGQAIQTGRILLGGQNRDLPPLETQLVQKINSHLVNRSRRMLSDLAEVSENIQRVEVEVFNSLGEKIIADNITGSKPVDNSKDKDKRDEGPVWDWGKFPIKSDEEAEIWEDELGFLRADLQSKCSK